MSHPSRFGAPELAVLQIDVVHDLADRAQRRVLDRRIVEQHLERAAVSLMRELRVIHVEADLAATGPIPPRRHELEARVRVDETLDEPRTRDAIDVDAAAGHPGPAGS